MRPETLKAKADLGFALHQGPRRRALQKDRQRQNLATIATSDSEAITAYLAPYTGRTLTTKTFILRRLHTWLGQAGTTLTNAGPLELDTYASLLHKRGYAASTISTTLKTIRHFYTWAHNTGHIPTNPATDLRVPKRPSRSTQKWLTADQLARFLKAATEAGPPWDLAAHLYSLNGLRYSEATTADIQDLGTIGDHTTLTLRRRKTSTMTTVSLPTPTVALLDHNIQGRKSGPLLTHRGRTFDHSTLRKRFDAISQAAGIDWPVRPHQLRATFITLALDAGIPYRDIAASSGHTDTKMIDYYDRAHASIERNVSHHLAAAVVGRAKQHHTTHGEWEE